MSNPNGFDRLQVRHWRPARWQLIALGVLALALAIALAIIAAGLLLILLPVALLTAIAIRLLGPRPLPRQDPPEAAPSAVIEADYEILTAAERSNPMQDDSTRRS